MVNRLNHLATDNLIKFFFPLLLVSQAIQVLLEDMKNLKLHILQLEEHRHKLCQMNEENQFNKDLEYNDLNYNYSDEEV